jgi:thioesterase domain-containing protein/acyl carrier protein
MLNQRTKIDNDERKGMVSTYPNRQSVSTQKIAVKTTDDVFVMPASVAQQRFWLLDQLEPGNTSFNMPLALRLNGNLDTVALQQTLNDIVSRHEVLRTTFFKNNGKLVQVIAPEQSLHLEEIDLSDLIECENEANRLMVAEAHITFDLAVGPLFKAKLIRLGAEEHILLLTLHHIICDGWSNGVLVREIGEIYDAFSHGRPSPYGELPIQYADFATWQQEWLSSDRFEEQLAYWKQHLGNELPFLEIPSDFPRNKNRTSFGAIESLLLPRALTRAIKTMGQREDATSFMIFLTAFNVLLHRYSGQDHILIGSPTANRMESQTEALIGAFANTLLLKSDLSADPSFKETLRRVKEVSLNAFSNQTLPFEKLVETVRPAQGRNTGQLFQVLFVFQTAFMQPMDLEDLTIMPIRSVSPGSIFELSLGVVERDEGTRLQLEYNTELFKDDTIRRMLDDLQNILHSAVLNSSRAISDLLYWTTPLSSREAQGSDALIEDDVRPTITVAPMAGKNGRIEDTLKDIWKEVLHIDSISIQDNFFEVGGHSLLAAQLFDEITNRLGVNLPLATLFEATTIEQLAVLIRDERPRDKWTSLVPINTGGTKPPLFLMHAAGGNVLFYKDLADRLGADQPCYGMQAVGLDGHQSAYDRIEDMAAHYIKEIRGVQPTGPYFLGGSSMGGIIAYEVGLQLREGGQDVQLIAMLDTYAPGYLKPLPGTSRLSLKFLDFVDRIQHHFESLRMLERGKRFSYFAAKAIKARNALRRSYIHKKRSVARGVLSSLGRPLPKALVLAQNGIFNAVRAYRPLPFDGNVVLFRASKQIRGIRHDDTLGWSKFVKGRIESHEIIGSHGSIVAEPRVRFVATILNDLLNAPEQISANLDDLRVNNGIT